MSGTPFSISEMRTAMGQFTGGRLQNETHQNFFETWAKDVVEGPGIRKRERFEIFDDFLAAALDATNNWLAFEGTDGAADIAITVTAPEGVIAMGSAAAGAAEDKTVLSLILLAKGSLVSLGKTIFETRVSFNGTANITWGFGLGDTLVNDTEVANFTVDSGVVADDGSVTNGVSFVYSTDATALTKWQSVSTKAGTVNTVENALSLGPTAGTYQILRLEVDADGVARFYIDGLLQATISGAVATDSLLIPYIWGDSAADGQTAVIVTNDYIYFSGARPPTN